jgi:hypothetical protein
MSTCSTCGDPCCPPIPIFLGGKDPCDCKKCVGPCDEKHASKNCGCCEVEVPARVMTAKKGCSTDDDTSCEGVCTPCPPCPCSGGGGGCLKGGSAGGKTAHRVNEF